MRIATLVCSLTLVTGLIAGVVLVSGRSTQKPEHLDYAWDTTDDELATAASRKLGCGAPECRP